MWISSRYCQTLFLSSLCFILFCSHVNGQNTISISIPWAEPVLIKSGDQDIRIPAIQNQSLSGRTPSFYWKEKKNRFPTQGISIDILTE